MKRLAITAATVVLVAAAVVVSAACGGTRGKSDTGQDDDAEVTFTKPGMYPYLCTLPGHAAAGMKGVLKVT